MKKIVSLFAILLLLASCSNKSESTIANSVAATNQLCPIQADAITTLERMEYFNDTITYYYTIDETQDPATMALLDASLDQLAENAKAAMRQPQTKPLLDACKELNTTVKFIYKGNQYGDEISFDYTPATKQTTLHNRIEKYN